MQTAPNHSQSTMVAMYLLRKAQYIPRYIPTYVPNVQFLTMCCFCAFLASCRAMSKARNKGRNGPGEGFWHDEELVPSEVEQASHG